MNRYRTTFPLDEPDVPDGDAAFIGVNERLACIQLTEGYVSHARNCRFNRGIIEPRKGVMKLGWSNLIGQADEIVPWGTIYGAGIFADPDDREWILVATTNAVFATHEGRSSAAVPLPAGTVINTPVEFVQAMGDMIMFRGPDLPELRMTSVKDGFTVPEQTTNVVTGPGTENPWDGTFSIPWASTGLFLQNRLLIPYERDLVAVSDYLNYTRYQPQAAVFRINQGSPDPLVALAKFNETTLICLKAETIYRVTGVSGDISTAALDEITRAYGCKARRSIVSVGTDLWFLADGRGVASITQTTNDKLQAVDLPVSEPIQPIIGRINWRYASLACAVYWDNRYYLSVPLDDSTVNNAVLVYDFLNASWAGYDDATTDYPLRVVAWLVHTYAGARRLFAVTDDGFLNLWEEGTADMLSAAGIIAEVPIQMEVRTRGYSMQNRNRKRWKEVLADLNTWAPRYSLTAIVDSCQQIPLRTNRTRSRTVYDKPFNRTPWVPTNANDDHATNDRGDYSLSPEAPPVTLTTQHTACRVATLEALAATRTGNVLTATANGLLNTAGIDAIKTLIVSDRVLVKDQAAAADNGIYTITNLGAAGAPWVMTRATDADASAEVVCGIWVMITAGKINGGLECILVTGNPITLNTTGLTWEFPSIDPGVNGLEADRNAATPDRRRIGATGGYVQIELTSDQGRVEVNTISVSASPGPRTGTKET
jgi:hypothetical protein